MKSPHDVLIVNESERALVSLGEVIGDVVCGELELLLEMPS